MTVVSGDAMKPRTIGQRLRALAKDCALAGLLALFILVFLFQPFRVEGVSMLPRFADRDRIIVNKLSYRVGAIARGDVVVFWFPEDPGKSFIKRVIGLPGDAIEIREGVVYVNGERLPEPYLAAEERMIEDRPAVRVGPGDYYVSGDHRGRSYDSRLWGLVPQRYIYGKVVLSYWPPDHIGLVAP
jgi:signal peptidase I